VFHLGSGFVRKNPMAAIAAFRRAFGDAPDRVMAIKLVDNGAHRARHELEAAISGVANIRLIEGMLPHADMAGLIDASDIVISLHRSEGFGLVLAQAMALGKPVVATGWSGNLDFMNEGNSALVSCSLVPVRDPDGAFDACDQEWAEPDIDHAADWLRRLADNADLRAKLSAAAAADIHAQLSPESVVRRIDDLVGRKSLTAQR
jgi:glycosyltransferase involved in cell wall biosynthesis